MTHRLVCRSTLPCRYPDRHTPACSHLFHGVSSRCHLSYMKPHPHDSGLGRETKTEELICMCAFSQNKKQRRRNTETHTQTFLQLANHPANHEQLHSTSWWSDVKNMEIKQFTGISLGSQGKAWARMCGLGLTVNGSKAAPCRTQRNTKTQTYWQWCSWSFPCQIRYRYSPRSCCPWVSHRCLPQRRTAGWSYRSTFPLVQPQTRKKGVLYVCFIKRNRELKMDWCG